MVTTELPAAAAPRAPQARIRPIVRRSLADRTYRGAASACSALTLALMGFIGLFLLVRGWDALNAAGLSFFTTSTWQPENGHFGVAAAFLGTVLIAGVAVVIALPVATGAALFITEYAPAAVRRPLTWLVDLLAAVPTIIYGLWGFAFLQPREIKLSQWLATHASFIPFFKTESGATYPASTLIAGTVVSLMVLPIATAVMREVFSQTPQGEKEGALALGGTKWGVARKVVIPFGKGGMIGGAMLGLGRALGETIAVTLIISPTFDFGRLPNILQTGGNSISSMIALRFSESNIFGVSALMAAGLVLFMTTLVVNTIASVIVSRSRSGATTEI
jgi:phosphate transport system permease protein